MKSTIIFILTLFAISFFSCTAIAQQNEKELKGEINEILSDSVKRSMAMQMIAEEPKMRYNMMSHIRKQMEMEMDEMPASEMIEKMRDRMNDQERMLRMRMHREMMRAMMNEEEILQKMDGNQDMRDMMIMHMMWMNMMQDGEMMSR